jgi:RNA polymerase sigma-70 factor (ECF subfamily)
LLRIRDPRDVESWREFVTTYGPLIYRFGRRYGLQDADASDVMQDVLAQVAHAVRSFEYQPELGRFRDWLGTVTRHRLLRVRQCHDRNPAVPSGGESAILERVAAPGQDAEWTAEFNAHVLQVALERARPHFEDQTWRAFERAWLDDCPAPAVATELGLGVDAVYVAKSRVLKRLRHEVETLAADLPLAASNAW